MEAGLCHAGTGHHRYPVSLPPARRVAMLHARPVALSQERDVMIF